MKSLFGWLAGDRGKLQLDALELRRRDALPLPQALDQRPLGEQRLVVLDLETSGLNMRNDDVLAIGALVIEQGGIALDSQYEATLRQDHKVSESILIHGLSPSTVAAGLEPAAALLDFMAFLDGSPVLGYHAPFDRHMLARALKEVLGYNLRNHFIDLAEVAPMLLPDACGYKAGLDDWVAHFGLQVLQRHSASADALVTAELALILFSQARLQGIHSLAALEQRLQCWRRRQQAHSL